MNYWILGGIVASLIALRFFKTNALVWVALVWVAAFVFLKWGFKPPAPGSIRGMYLSIVSVALLLYVSSDRGRAQEAMHGLRVLLFEKKWRIFLVLLLLAYPLAQAIAAYQERTATVAPPPSGRTIHPAPPEAITVRGKKIDIIRGENPFRKLETEDPKAFAEHLQNGRGVYYRNCVFCHGDDLRGDGIYAPGLDPLPANLNSATTIGMLTETFLMWRIAKGGPGLPEEGAPWSTAMPAWEDRLSETDIWDVILFMYQYTGLKPRAVEKVE